jgi:hypothetical protein
VPSAVTTSWAADSSGASVAAGGGEAGATGDGLARGESAAAVTGGAGAGRIHQMAIKRIGVSSRSSVLDPVCYSAH